MAGPEPGRAVDVIESGRAILGIELGSTRIKAALIAPEVGWDATRQKEEVTAYQAQPRLSTII